MLPAFNVIVACSENRVIGRAGRLPWRIPEDWSFFRQRTARSTVVLGRISFQSWRSVLEDERRAVVLTRNTSLAGDRVEVAHSLTAGLAAAGAHGREIYVCGGQRVFAEAIALPSATRLYLTLIHAHVDGDRTFPEWRHEFPRVLEQREGGDENYRYTFFTLARA
ncbi:dihydrofolate reductase [Opitutus terrae]|uniref:dihydrofolate reductase n=1 Tax=Opitutus terrae (strain DSM 11246 / JCM 15787 / PB90-1) TaxID=452637 RepID=B1ZSC9_OPITP|nr:dihydrofolate reductase [Opitutus terrae]ACB75728.1 dihydrofolate reductase region [Opitutus terrae PB90-1]